MNHASDFIPGSRAVILPVTEITQLYFEGRGLWGRRGTVETVSRNSGLDVRLVLDGEETATGFPARTLRPLDVIDLIAELAP